MAVEFILSEWGKHKDFESLEDAVKFVKKKKIKEDDYLIWIQGTSRLQMDNWKRENEKVFDNESMRVSYKRAGIRYIWCCIYKQLETEEKYNSL